MKTTRCLLILLFAFLTMTPAFAEAPYFESSRIVDDIWVLNLVTADMDGDGDPDFVIGCDNAEGIRWYENEDAVFDTYHAIDIEIEYDSRIDVADMDEDGTNDILFVSDAGELWLYYNTDGTGLNFVPELVDPNFDEFAPCILDYNGDGRPEIVTTPNVKVYSYTGNDWVVYDLDQSASQIYPIDFDFDGDMDFVSFYQSHAYWHENTGQGFTIHETGGGHINQELCAGDFDMDGDIDIAGTRDYDSVMVLKVNSGDNIHFTDFEFEGPREATTCADVNGDGLLDLLVYSSAYLDMHVWLNQGGGYFETIPVPTQPSGQPIAFADFDGDNRLDLISYHHNFYQDIFLHLQRGVFGFERHAVTNEEYGVWHTEMFDMDGDDDQDVVLGCWDGGKFFVYEQVDDGFVEHLIADYSDGGAIAVGDFDLDGDGDVIINPEENNSIYLLRQTSPWTFEPESITTTYLGNRCNMSTVDMDSDGDLDVIIACEDNNAVDWWENDGGATFTRHIVDDFLIDAFMPRPFDLDQDGDLDILITTFVPSYNLGWQENAGDNETWTFELLMEDIDGGYGIDGGDLDGDGDMDIAIGSGIGLVWLENDGMSFTPAPILSGYRFGALEIVDLDGDGDDDMYATQVNESDMYWVEQLGGGEFELHLMSKQMDSGRDLGPGDFDGDGDVDVVVASRSMAHVALWENTLNVGYEEVPLALQPQDPPYVFPSSGGSFVYTAALGNPLNQQVSARAQTSVVLPTGETRRLNQRSVLIPPASLFLTDPLMVDVPSGLEPGMYEYVMTLFRGPVLVTTDSFWFSVTDAPGVATLAGEGTAVMVPDKFTVGQAYPNPFNARTSLAVTLPHAGELHVEVYNTLGRRVRQVVSGEYAAGRHEVSFDANSLASGLYFIRVEFSGKPARLQKVMLVR